MIAAGTKISPRYTVVSYVASGGMQDVYKARDELTGEEVALKTPKVGQAQKRFKQSAILSARINNYNVAKTFDYFETDGACYLIEEFIDGSTLEEATLEKVPQIDPHLASYLLLRLSKGLAASHAAGVAHRDLKPSNILVTPDFSNVKITDFGIATLADSLFEEILAKDGNLTRSTSGTVRGALPFMAPEMLFRKAGDKVGHEADIWSLGAMMFRLMADAYPFGEGMMVPVNVEKKKPLEWPVFMTSNAQFSTLSKSLISIVERCVLYDKAARPSATEVVALCEDLCFNFSRRVTGVVDELRPTMGFVRCEDGSRIFFHFDSLYGPQPKLTDKVIFSHYAGTPWPRAHPLMRCR